MFKLCIDPGHGGDEPGAVANGYFEKNINLETAMNLKEEMERCGVAVFMTRTADTTMSLEDRGKIAIDNNVDCIISVHFNSFSQDAKGVEVLYSFLKESREGSKWIAECILEEAAKLGMYKRSVWTKESGTMPGRNYFGVLRGAEPIPGVICEGLFITNPGDVMILKRPNFLKDLAKAYAKGLCIAYGMEYKEFKQVDPEPTPYKDWDRVSDYAKEAVKALQKAGIMVGDAGFFKPREPISRQDTAVVLYNALKKNNLI